jgi:hypothetical protein
VVPLLWLALDASAYVMRYLPLTEEELTHRFPQHVIRKHLLPYIGDEQESVSIGSTTIRFLQPSRIQFDGTDRAGKHWTVTASAEMGGALYSADLDHNGTADLIYASDTGGNGWAPSMHVLILLFDQGGRPVPSEMDGYFEIDARGLKDLLDLDGDGRAELIRQAYDDGYWITSAYEAVDAHWHRIIGRHASRTFPLYTRFTNRANREPTTPAPGRHPTEDDLSNDTVRYSSELAAVRWADIQMSSNPEIDLSDGTVCSPVAWYSTMVVVMDTAEGRQAATLGASEEAHKLLDAIMTLGLPVELKGKRRYAVTGDRERKPTPCVPETVWASRPVNLR